MAEIEKKVSDIADKYLGIGYDICGYYADGVSIKKKLFDLSKVPPRDIQRIPNRSANYFSVEGETYESFQSNLTAKALLAMHCFLDLLRLLSAKPTFPFVKLGSFRSSSSCDMRPASCKQEPRNTCTLK